MIQVDEGTTNPHGEALVEELLWVHGILRSNLATIAALVERIAAGAPAEQIHDAIKRLAATSALWTLQVNCLRYCSLVHHHHRLEDVALFPGLRRANPELCPVIDKLEADHSVVAQQLAAVEVAADRILKDATAREELAAALQQLSAYLLAHLDYEEQNISPTLRRLTAWPLG